MSSYLGYQAYMRLDCCGELDALREFAQDALDQGRDTQPMVGLMLFERRFDDAIALLREPDPDESAGGLSLRRRALVAALRQVGEEKALQSEAASYRADLEALIAEHPDTAPAYEHLGFVHVALGNPDLASEQFARADALRRPDAVRYGGIVSNRAAIYAISGYTETALNYLEESLAVPAGIGWPAVDIDPAFDLLREHPRYLALQEKYASN